VAEVDPSAAGSGAAKVMHAPSSGTTCGLPGTLLAIIRLADSLPATVAVNATLMVHVEPTAIAVLVQAFDCVKSDALVPPTAMAETISAFWPVFLMVSDLEPEGSPETI
jgi:hypothetical protein